MCRHNEPSHTVVPIESIHQRHACDVHLLSHNRKQILPLVQGSAPRTFPKNSANKLYVDREKPPTDASDDRVTPELSSRGAS